MPPSETVVSEPRPARPPEWSGAGGKYFGNIFRTSENSVTGSGRAGWCGLWAVGGIVILETVSRLGSDWVLAWFCRPAGRLAGWFFNTPMQVGDDGILVLHHALMDLRITPDCSGFSFFMLLVLALGCLLINRGPRAGIAGRLLVLIPVAYALTLVTNMLRLVLSVYGRAFCDRFLVPDMADAMHLASGVVIFLPVLIITYLFLERKIAHAR